MGSVQRQRAVWCLAAVAALALACAGPQRQLPAAEAERQSQRPASPTRITAIIMGDPATFSSALGSSRGAGSVPGQTEMEDMMMAGLSNVDDHGELRPELAEAVPSLVNGLWTLEPGGRMATTWQIRTGAEWHDGVPFTTDDLLFTARVGQEKQIPQMRLTNPVWAMIESIDAPDPRTITLHWNRPFLKADSMFSNVRAMPIPRYLLEAAYVADPAAFADLPYWGPEFVGTGAYKLRELVSGSHLTLVANPKFVAGRPKIDEIQVNFVQDANAMITHLLAGSAELTLGARISMDQALEVREQWRDGRVEFAPNTLLALYPQFINPDPPILLDVRLRRALLEIVDRQQMMEALVRGLTSVAHSTVSPNQADYPDVESAIVRYPFDSGAAAQLISELGYAKGSDGFYQDAAGTKLKVDLRASAQHDLHPKTVASVGDAWRQTGISVDQLITPNQRIADLEYRHTRPGFEVLALPNEPEYFQTFHSSQAPLPSNGFVGLNRSRYMNPEYDALVDQYFVTMVRPERMQVLRQIVHQLSDQVVVMPLFYATVHTIIGNRIKKVTQRGPGSTDGWNSEQWELQ